MKKKPLNREHINGKVYDHKLAFKTSKKGVSYIGGDLYILTDCDDAKINIVPIKYVYVTADRGQTYSTLEFIINKGKTILNDSLEEATIVTISPTIGVNEYYTEPENERCDITITQRNEGGGFYDKISNKLESPKKRNTFETDVILTRCKRIEMNPERGIEKDYVELKGFVPHWSNTRALIPVKFSVRSDGGMKYFESLDLSEKNFIFTKVWGNIVNSNIVTKKSQQSAFDEDLIVEDTKTIREWEITGASPDIYPRSEEGLTEAEFDQMKEIYKKHLMDVRQGQIEYQNNAKNVNNGFSGLAATPKSEVTPSAATGAFMGW